MAEAEDKIKIDFILSRYLDSIMILDKSGGYTAFFKDYPEIITEGDTKKAAYKNLLNTKHDIDKYKQETDKYKQ